MTAIVPIGRPQMSRKDLLARYDAAHPNEPRPPYPFLIFVRGYYGNRFGASGNDRRVYDDAVFVLTDTEFYSFNANTDPNGYRAGHGDGLAKGMASLKAGVYPHTWGFGMHKGKYEAITQIKGPVTVVRDGNPPEEHTGMYGINIHMGGVNGTSSLGCQTLPPAQWPAFIALVHGLFERMFGAVWHSKTVPVVLLEFTAP